MQRCGKLCVVLNDDKSRDIELLCAKWGLLLGAQPSPLHRCGVCPRRKFFLHQVHNP